MSGCPPSRKGGQGAKRSLERDAEEDPRAKLAKLAASLRQLADWTGELEPTVPEAHLEAAQAEVARLTRERAEALAERDKAHAALDALRDTLRRLQGDLIQVLGAGPVPVSEQACVTGAAAPAAGAEQLAHGGVAESDALSVGVGVSVGDTLGLAP